MKLLLDFKTNVLEWPSWLPSQLRENLASLFPEEASHTLPMNLQGQPSAYTMLEALFMENVERAQEEWEIIEGSALGERNLEFCESVADYMGSMVLLRRIWKLRGFKEVRLDSFSLSKSEIDARPPLHKDLFPAEPWLRDGTLVDPYEDWNIMYFLIDSKKPTGSLHLLPGCDKLGRKRHVFRGAKAGDFAIVPLKSMIAANIRKNVKWLLDESLQPFWWNPETPSTAGMILAGGAALELLRVSSPPQYREISDYDLFFVGSQEEVQDLCAAVLATFEKKCYNYLRTPNTITIEGYYHRQPLQFVTRVYKSVEDVLASFDFGAAKVAMTLREDRSPHFMVARDAIEDIRTGVIRIDPYRQVDQLHLLRYVKYANKGFAFGSPVPFSWANTGALYETPIQELQEWTDALINTLQTKMETEEDIPFEWCRFLVATLQGRTEAVSMRKPFKLPPYQVLYPLNAMSRLGQICSVLATLDRGKSIFQCYSSANHAIHENMDVQYGSFEFPEVRDSSNTIPAPELVYQRMENLKELIPTYKWITDTTVPRSGSAIEAWVTCPARITIPAQQYAEEYLLPRLRTQTHIPYYCLKESSMEREKEEAKHVIKNFSSLLKKYEHPATVQRDNHEMTTAERADLRDTLLRWYFPDIYKTLANILPPPRGDAANDTSDDESQETSDDD